MILRDGYIMTELGELPVDWVINSLKDTAKVVTGKTPATQNPMFWGGNIPWITPSDIDGQRDIFTSERMLSAEGFSNNPAKLPPNTILVTCIASIGKNAITRTISSCNQQINAILPSPKYISEFLYYWISNNKDYYVSNAAKTAVMILNKSTFENLPVVLPPLREQQKIADILFTVDDHISETEFLIEKTKVLKQGMMQQLLTKGIGHTEFKDTEVGRIPVEWEVVKFRNCISILSGYPFESSSFNDFGDGIRIVRIRDINNPGSKTYYSGKFDDTYVLSNGDCIIGMDGDFKIRKWNEGPAVLNQRLCKISETLGGPILDYVYHILGRILTDIQSRTAATTVKHLSTKDINNSLFPLPPQNEQEIISTLLTTIDDQIGSYQTKLTALTKLKSALMQQLLTGKTRVKI